jgi:hypothetical protein
MKFTIDTYKEQYNPIFKDSLTEEELKHLDSLSKDELKNIMSWHYNEFNTKNALQNGLKLCLNSLYGAFGNEYFVCSTPDIAGAITAMGRDVIKYMDKVNEEYWYNYWHLDSELHDKLGINTENIIPLDSSWIHRESKTLYDGIPTDLEVEEGIYQRKLPVSNYVDTDSIINSSTIYTDLCVSTVEGFYHRNTCHGSAGSTETGHESVKTNEKVLNWSKDKGLYYANVKRIIRHKVTKPKYELKTKSGNKVIITGDHSLVIFRDGIELVIKPNEVKSGDKVISCKYHKNDKNNINLIEYFDEIESCEMIGQFEDEYVYDIEVADDTHTFIADSILVHNSCFITFNPAMLSMNYTGDPMKFIFTVAKERLEPLFKKKLEGYAKKYHVKNIQDFELENVNESILFLAKKQYIKHTIWEDKVDYTRLENLVPKGVPLIQKGTPPFARDKIMDIIKYIFDNHTSYSMKDILKFTKDIKKQFELADIDSLCKSTSVNAYWSSKTMVDGLFIDTPGIIKEEPELEMAKGTYYTVKAAGYYNHLLLQNKDLLSKYELIRPGMKIKYYFCKNGLNERFAYPIGQFPYEFAPDMDKDVQFMDTITNGVNRYVKALGLPEMTKRLTIIANLF